MQSERLRQLLQDISTITRMDEASQLIERENVDIHAIVQDIIAEVALRPADKRMRINCNFDRELPIFGNANLLTSIFRNLTENAIAYSGGRDIFINLTKETPEEYVFSFADNGIGIDSQHLSHIFERFYRVDKGRSRKLGGTGLGLSIVKTPYFSMVETSKPTTCMMEVSNLSSLSKRQIRLQLKNEQSSLHIQRTLNLKPN